MSWQEDSGRKIQNESRPLCGALRRLGTHHLNPAIGLLLHYYSSRHPHGPQSESGGVLPRLRLETVQPHEGEFANRLPPILKPHEAASDRGGVPLPPRGVHPAIELAGCTAGLRPPGLEPPWRVVEAGPAKARERRAGIFCICDCCRPFPTGIFVSFVRGPAHHPWCYPEHPIRQGWGVRGTNTHTHTHTHTCTHTYTHTCTNTHTHMHTHFLGGKVYRKVIF